jgi:hypothetical protein
LDIPQDSGVESERLDGPQQLFRIDLHQHLDQLPFIQPAQQLRELAGRFSRAVLGFFFHLGIGLVRTAAAAGRSDLAGDPDFFQGRGKTFGSLLHLPAGLLFAEEISCRRLPGFKRTFGFHGLWAG